MRKETRFLPLENMEIRKKDDEKGILHGLAVPYNTITELWEGFSEEIRPEAFDGTLADGNSDIFAFFGHDSNKIIGRNKNGTLKLDNQEDGLYFEIIPPNTETGREALELVENGYLDGVSIGFVPEEDSFSSRDDGGQHRVITECQLLEVSLVAMPAYGSTKVSKRDREYIETRCKDCSDGPLDNQESVETGVNDHYRMKVELMKIEKERNNND